MAAKKGDFDTRTLATMAFKKALRKAHTTNIKGVSNEAISSAPVILQKDIWAEDSFIQESFIQENGSIDSGTDPKVFTQKLKFGLKGIISSKSTTIGSNLHVAFEIIIPTDADMGNYGALATTKNPGTGANYVAGDRIQNLITDEFGVKFMPQIFLQPGNTEVYFTDDANLIFDNKAGVLTQEFDITSDMKNFDGGDFYAYVYVGQFGFSVVASEAKGDVSALETKVDNLETQLLGKAALMKEFTKGTVALVDGKATLTHSLSRNCVSVTVYREGEDGKLHIIIPHDVVIVDNNSVSVEFKPAPAELKDQLAFRVIA